jgi:hypothetical protein
VGQNPSSFNTKEGNKMKSILALVFSLIAFTPSKAQAWDVNANLQVSSWQVSASVSNSYGAPIICSGSVWGIMTNGISSYAYMTNQIIYPGYYKYVYVYTNTYPFYQGDASISCNWY